MPRRTKEEAQATRSALLDAAERVFQRQGVAASSLADIAAEAGTTRGAIYWHFQDKADLFNAMMDRVLLPMETAIHQSAEAGPGDRLQRARDALVQVLERTASDERTQRVFEIATHKVEYVQGLASVRERHLAVRAACITDLQGALAGAAGERGLGPDFDPCAAAQGLHALVDGLIHNWILDRGAFDLPRVGAMSIDALLAGVVGERGSPRSRG